jgi:hypothetical protein
MGAADERSRLPFAALGFAAAAAFSAWNPLTAPFGVNVGLAALALGVRALVRAAGRGRKIASAAAIVLALGAVGGGALVLSLTAGVGRDLRGEPIVPVPPRGTLNSELDAAAERTRPARERARTELDTLEPPPGERPAGAPPEDAGGARR